MRKTLMAALLGAGCALLSATAGAVDLERYLRDDAFTNIKISPDGTYVAASVPLQDATAIAILRTSDMAMVGSFRPPRDNHAGSFDWVSNERLVIGLAQKWGRLDKPRPTGELYGINADGRSGELLVGYRVGGLNDSQVSAFLTDELADDERNVLIAVWPFAENPYTRIERMDAVTGRRIIVARSPVQGAHFTTDNTGEVRFALGSGSDNVQKLYYRVQRGEDWVLLNDEAVSRRVEKPLGFSADGSLAYLWIEQAEGPDAIVSWNPQTNERHTLLRDEVVDPGRVIYQPGTRIPVGALYYGDVPKARFFDDTSSTARLYRSLQAALRSPVYITSSTRDGRIVLAQTWSGSNPGDFYRYDTVEKKARLLASRSSWIDPSQSAQVRPVALKARDGLPLHGFLTVPNGKEARQLPMVVVPHGGPIGVFDDGSYEHETQLLAAAGYAVLQINFRGSSNYGRAHTAAARHQWGLRMQDDVTDATRWAIEQGIADGKRICIYGASYGAYAALMGTVREPGLYQCAAGYVGIYDLPLMFERGDIQSDRSGMTYLRDWLGAPEALAERSPVNLAAQVKVPVFLAAGGEDKRAPIQHTKKMEAALRRAGTPVESLYYKSEGHGFYTPQHQREYYSRLLAFLSRSLGGQTASASTAAQP
ncbi:S9 family peptidase [Stenotrophomonas sp. SORGH_AS_0282]|uniref:alpha/beta hydrolase family protein n=1 Tax=Stenotrophomonas sp. SORGH_AS_0282 TaxID=3041763 RepID=UPI002783594B|nr:S9 family peptidase [Stenotrophomonas sp. SORGH_AS_0282]MDQ1063404.1 dipeptidyl aminopeptidase/acylaminoacyl peptidase [Stenotrophomonas sp. SORGH_AS_0282]MDQ1188236.1 dipeptidyl aminopeptidase/acylaminoacyl peptidase [Stenotrophomonas sp. SORGH_AS_0282]